MTNQEKRGHSEAVSVQQYSDDPFLVVGFSRVKRGPQNPAVGQIVSTGNVCLMSNQGDFCTSFQMCRGTRMSALAIFTHKTIDDKVSPVRWLLSLRP